MTRVREENRTLELFEDLNADFDTFVDQSRRVEADRQARALANVQIYGAAIATSGAAAGLLAVVLNGVQLCTQQRVAIAGAVVLLGYLVALIVDSRTG